jgi:hypothetical protein
MMDKDDRKLAQIRRLLEEVEEKVETAKRILFEQVYKEQAEILQKPGNASTLVEGVFDGVDMIDADGRKYHVPVNYSSKSKLVPGDSLKLTIAADGSFIFKQIGPVERKRLIAKLTKNGENWIANSDGKKYRCLAASVTYFKAKANDKITIVTPKTGESEWAAIENLIGG